MLLGFIAFVWIKPIYADEVLVKQNGSQASGSSQILAMQGSADIAMGGQITSRYAGKTVPAATFGCGGAVTLGVSGAIPHNATPVSQKCQSQKMHKQLAEEMDKYLLSCAKNAAKEAPELVGNIGDIKGIHVHHMGCVNDRPMRTGSKPSKHATGEALDIAGFTLKGDNGATATVSFDQRAVRRAPGSKNFYEAFRRCWDDALKCQPGSIGGTFSNIPPKNTLHNDHLHLQICKPGEKYDSTSEPIDEWPARPSGNEVVAQQSFYDPASGAAISPVASNTGGHAPLQPALVAVRSHCNNLPAQNAPVVAGFSASRVVKNGYGSGTTFKFTPGNSKTGAVGQLAVKVCKTTAKAVGSVERNSEKAVGTVFNPAESSVAAVDPGAPEVGSDCEVEEQQISMQDICPPQ